MRVKTELIRDAESDNVVSFKVQRRTSGLNRKLSVLTNFEAISNNLRVETGITRHAESNDDVSFRVQTRNTGLKKRRLVHQLPRAKREVKKRRLVNRWPRAKPGGENGDWSTNCLEQNERRRRETGQPIASSEARG